MANNDAPALTGETLAPTVPELIRLAEIALEAQWDYAKCDLEDMWQARNDSREALFAAIRRLERAAREGAGKDGGR